MHRRGFGRACSNFSPSTTRLILSIAGNLHWCTISASPTAEGHIRSIVIKLEEGRNCLDMPSSCGPWRKRSSPLHDHLDHCLDSAAEVDGESARAQIKESKANTECL
jgi:DNA-binding FrmR family transcriptional regulator